jgi:hypothetical protein
MRAANQCVQLLDPLIDAVMAGDHVRTEEIAKEISVLEHEADEIKNELRDHMPRSLFLPVAREDLLDILSIQDSISDAAEDVGMVVTMRKMEVQTELKDFLDPLVHKTLESVSCYSDVIGELDRLVNASFVGKEAQRVMDLIRKVSQLEHEADVAQDALSRRLFEIEDSLKAGALFMWIEIIRRLGSVANRAEKAANRLRMFLAT